MKHIPFKNLFKLVLRLSIIGVIAYSLYLNLYAGFGSFQSWLLLFYTTQSNALVMVVFIVLSIQDLRQIIHQGTSQNDSKNSLISSQSARLQDFKTALTWAISITGIVWHVILVPQLEEALPQVTAQTGLTLSPQLMLSLTLLHTWSPLLAFIDWLLFSPRNTIKRFTPFKWLLIPIVYFLFICFWVNVIGPIKPEYHFTYPYPFLDFQANGVAKTCLGLGVIAFCMLVLGYVYLILDQLLAKLLKIKGKLNTSNT